MDKMVRIVWEQEIRQMLPVQESDDDVQPEGIV